jgi:hypothetical protein
MAEQAEVSKKSKTEYTTVKMSDGREVQFAGKRKVNKETLIDETKIEVDEAGGVIQLQSGAISVRMDFRNGDTRTIPLPLSLLAKFAGHGGEQKFGDELASPADKPLSEEDMVIAIDDLNSEIQAGKWGKGRAEGGGGVAGAGIVVRAIAEASGKTVEFVKAFLQKKLDDSAAKDGDKKLMRKALYDSFRVAGTKTGVIIQRMEDEKRAKDAAAKGINADEALGEMEAAQ